VFHVVGLIDFATVTYQGGQYGKKRARSGASPTSNDSPLYHVRLKVGDE